MQTREITYDEFLSYNAIKPGIVHIHQGLVFKHSPNSEELIETIETITQGTPVRNHITIPHTKLKVNNNYFGYQYDFNNKLRQVEDALFLEIIKDEEQFATLLLTLIDELNKLDLCYWDFHRNNVFSDQLGHPFLIDLDDIKYQPKPLNMYHQLKYLTEYLLNLYLKKEKILLEYRREPLLQQYFSQKTIEYIQGLGKKPGTVTELPYCIIDEFSDTYKKEELKIRIK